MKLDPGIYIDMHSVLSLKPDVTDIFAARKSYEVLFLFILIV